MSEANGHARPDAESPHPSAGPDAPRRYSPKVFVITGPSGVGKGTLIRTLLDRIPALELSVSATTRKPRLGETHGVDYH